MLIELFQAENNKLSSLDWFENKFTFEKVTLTLEYRPEFPENFAVQF